MDVEKLSLLMEVQTTKFENQLKRQNATAYRIFKQLEDRASAMEKSVGASFGALGKRVAGAFAGIAVGSALNDIRKTADEYAKIVNTLKVAGVSDAQRGNILDALMKSAQDNAVPLEALASLYGRVSQAQTTLNTSSGELLKFTDLVSQALRVGGTSATEAQGALLQLGQALSAGKVSSEEYNSMLEGAYPLLQAVAAGLKEAGGDVAKLTQLVKSGQVSSEAFYRAGLAGAQVLQDKLAGAVTTTEQATQRLKNEFTLAVGKFDEAVGLTPALVKGLDGVASSMAGIGSAATSTVLTVGALIDKLGELAKANAGVQRQQALSYQEERAARVAAAREMGTANAGGRATVAAEQAAANEKAAAANRKALADFRSSEADFANNLKTTTQPPARPKGLGAKTGPTVSINDFKVPGDKDGKGSGGGSSKEALDAYEKALVASEKRRQALLLEAETEGKGTFAKAKAREALELETAAKRANIPVTEAMRKKIDEAATGYANAKVKVEEVQKAVEGFNDASKFFGEGITDALGDLIIDGEKATDVMKALVKQLAKAALQAALMGSGPLAGIFGTSSGTSAPGGIIGKLNGRFA